MEMSDELRFYYPAISNCRWRKFIY